ncbi:MAG: N-6 DNA methylase [Chloroflexi bacterium]|nr:N-6 DNA methylase [Chloroflexota bacterium]
MPPQIAYDQIERLVKRFKNLPSRERHAYNEDNTRKDFILPLFRALEWNIDDAREVTAEEKISRGFVDFAFRIGGVPKFMLETKRVGEDLNKREWAQQAVDYAYHKDVTWAVLSDFEGLKIINAEIKESNPLAATFKSFAVDEYVTRLNELWLLSRPAFAEGLLDRDAEKVFKRSIKTPITQTLFDNLTTWRKSLYKNLRAYNPLWSDQDIDDAVQRLLDRLIFIRTAEDREVEGEKLRALVRELQDRNRLNDLIPALSQRFRALDGIYNSELFAPHLCESLTYEPTVLVDIIEQLYGSEASLLRYNFAFIDADVLGRAYEQYLGNVVAGKSGRGVLLNAPTNAAPTKSKRKSQGIYYTPTFVVKYIVQQTLGRYLDEHGYNPSRPLRVLDPACGSGSFLIEAFDVLDQYIARTTGQDRPIPPTPFPRREGGKGDRLDMHDYARHRQILSTNIFGVDKDAQAVEVAQLNLLLKALNHREKLPKLENIRCGDSLISGTPKELEEYFGASAKEKNAFNWEREFKTVMADGGFDVIVGNPPYGMLQPHNTDKATLDYLNAKYGVASFKIDMFHLFMERCIHLLRGGGYLGLIVPNTFITNVYTQKLRDLLVSNCRILAIVVSQEKIFSDAEVNNAIIVFQKELDADKCDANYLTVTLNADVALLTGQPSASSTHKLRQSDMVFLGSGSWNIKLSDEAVKPLKRIQAHSTSLGDVAKINRGLISGDREKYFAAKPKSKKWLPIITGTDVSRYSIQQAKEFVLFEKPAGAGGCWDPQVHQASKIVIRQIGYFPIAAYDTHPYCVTGNIFTVRSTGDYLPQFLLGILNSKFTQALWQLLYGDFKAIFPELKGIYLEQYPIRRINFADPAEKKQHDAIVALVEEMLDLQKDYAEVAREKLPRADSLKRKIDAVDAEIDAAVYRLYDLNAEEIKVVEGKE